MSRDPRNSLHHPWRACVRCWCSRRWGILGSTESMMRTSWRRLAVCSLSSEVEHPHRSCSTMASQNPHPTSSWMAAASTSSSMIDGGCSSTHSASVRGPSRSSSRITEEAIQSGLLETLHDENVGHVHHHHHGSTSDFSNHERNALLEFLEKHEEEGAALVATWISLRRSCLFASEISESLSLHVRYMLHKLISMRAIAAACQLYERLVYLGVQLSQSDVLLLLSNLPYEHGSHSAQVGRLAAEEAEQQKSRAGWLRRRQEMKEAERAAMQRGTMSTPSATAASSPDTNTAEEVVMEVGASSSSSSSSSTTSMTLQTKGLAHQPEWIKRWVLYEASMGNLDLLEPDEPQQARRQQNNAQTSSHDAWESVKPIVAAEVDAAAWAADHWTQVLAQLQHLHVLLVGAASCANHNTSSSSHSHNKPRRCIRVRRQMKTTAERHLWREALHVITTSHASAAEHGAATSSTSPSSSSSSLVEAVPSGVELRLHALLRDSFSWSGALANAQRTTSHADVVLFFRLAVDDAPWSTSRKVERVVSEVLVPHVRGASSADGAIQSLWLLYLARVKLERAESEDFMQLYATAHASWALDDGTGVMHLLDAALDRLQEGIPRLLDEVRRFRRQREAEAVLAASIRSGIYAPRNDDDHDGGGGGGGQSMNEPVLQPSSMQEPLAHGVACRGGILTHQMMDSFILCCAALAQSVGMLLLLSTDGAAVHAHLAEVLFGPQGLWCAWATHFGDEGGMEAPERGYVGLILMAALIRVVMEMVSATSLTSPVPSTEVQLVLEQVLSVLASIPSHYAATSLPSIWRGDWDQRTSSLRQTICALARPLLRFLKVHPEDERIVFGAVPPTTIACLVGYGKLLARVEMLASSSSSSSVLSAKQRALLRSVFGGGFSLSKRIRAGLSKRELTVLEEVLHMNAHRPRRVVAAHGDEEFRRRLQLREEVYGIVLAGTCSSQVEKRLTEMVAGADGARALQLLQIAVRDVRVPAKSLSPAFFSQVVDRLASSAAQPKRVMGDDVPDTTKKKFVAQPSSSSSSSTWMSAIHVFWSAVDHHGEEPTTPALDAQSAKLGGRVVLTQMLPSLLRLSEAVHRRDLGRQWRRSWAALFTSDERHEREWRAMNARALSMLRDASALELCVELRRSTEPQHKSSAEMAEDLLLLTARQHPNWLTALKAVMELHGTTEHHEKHHTTYPVAVAETILHVLANNRNTNLSNSAMRLRTLQGSTWSAECSLVLTQLLLRSRRWRLALTYVEEALEEMQLSSKLSASSSVATPATTSSSSSSRPTDEYFLHAATLLVRGLHACAIGGESTKAAEWFSDFQHVMEMATGHAPPTPSGAASSSSPTEDHVDVALQQMADLMMDQRPTRSSGDESPQMQKMADLASSARAFFMRAMTKRLLPKN